MSPIRSRRADLLPLVLLIVLVGCQRQDETSRRPPTPSAPSQPSITSFQTTARTSEALTGLSRLKRTLNIKYTGKDVLEDVVIEVSLHFVSREKGTETAKFEKWLPGETQSIESDWMVGRSVHYSWNGVAKVNGKEVTLMGNEGDHQ